MTARFVMSACGVALVVLIASVVFTKDVGGHYPTHYRGWARSVSGGLIRATQHSSADLPLSATVADTFHLGWFDFEGPDTQGWTSLDRTQQIDEFFHVADATELDGGDSGKLVPIEGRQSMWCGVAPSSAIPFCSYSSLPGYGNRWHQRLESEWLECDSIRLAYRICWDSEPGYDFTDVEYYDMAGDVWVALPANGGAGRYDGAGLLDETLVASVTADSTRLRFRFTSDRSYSDEDGLWPTDGAVVLDSITVQCFQDGALVAAEFEDFESASPGDKAVGIWAATSPAPFGDYAAVYPGVSVVQNRDECFFNSTQLWGFFDDPAITNYGCGDFPQQGAIAYGPNADGLYMENAVVSPLIPVVGTGDEFVLSYLIYSDLPFNSLVYDFWEVRSWTDGCPGAWRGPSFFIPERFGGWGRWRQEIGHLIDPAATHIQVMLGTVDLCPELCGVFGTNDCQSHAPLYDEVHLIRINPIGPQFSVRHIDLFQDNFAEDGTLTGTARADAAADILPSNNPAILPGDSVTVAVENVTTDAHTGLGPAVYVYVAVWPLDQPGKTPADLQAPEVRAGIGSRWPLVATQTVGGVMWAQFRMDTAFTAAGVAIDDRYCIDLGDHVLTPGDTVCYFFGARSGDGNEAYWSRRLNGQGDDFVTADLAEAASSPCEFTILPAGGWRRGGDILYVDGSDDSGGPAQLFFDSALEVLSLGHLVDRYDVLGPSSGVNNTPASRVSSVQTQIMDCYRSILWNSGNLSSGTIGDGTGFRRKPDDFGLLFTFLDQRADDPGLYMSGDNVANQWVVLSGAGATGLRSTYMNFDLHHLDHVAAGEPISPTLTAVGPCFVHGGVPDQLIAFGGCPLINNFDLLTATGLSQPEFANQATGKTYTLSQASSNSAGATTRVILSGFSYHYIRDAAAGFPPVRVVHLFDILTWLGHGLPTPTAVEPTPELADYLGSAYPNPFNPTTTIRYGIRGRTHVSLKIYNAAGQLVKTLVNRVQAPRPEGFEVKWDGDSNAGVKVASGVYFYRLLTREFEQTKKMVLLK